jgi:hypothetical protein
LVGSNLPYKYLPGKIIVGNAPELWAAPALLHVAVTGTGGVATSRERPGIMQSPDHRTANLANFLNGQQAMPNPMQVNQFWSETSQFYSKWIPMNSRGKIGILPVRICP